MLRHKKNLHFRLAYFQALPFSYWKWDSENLKKVEKISLSRPQSFPYKLWHFIKKRQWHYGNDPIEKRRKPPPSLTSTSMGHHYIWKPMFTINYPWECLLFYLLLLEFWDAKAALVIFHLYLDNFLLANPITLEAIQNMIPFFIDLESAPFPPFLLESNMFHRPWKCARICSLLQSYFHLLLPFKDTFFILYYIVETLASRHHLNERWPSSKIRKIQETKELSKSRYQSIHVIDLFYSMMDQTKKLLDTYICPPSKKATSVTFIQYALHQPPF